MLSHTSLRRAAILGCAAALMVLPNCKPAAKPSADQTSSPVDSGGEKSVQRQPSAGDLRAYCQTLLPPVMRLADLKTDVPVRAPNISPADNVWLINVKLTLTPAEDLLALASPEDTHAIDSLVGELNGLIAWRNAYVRSPYVRTCGGIDVAAPSGPVPQLLVVAQAKDKPLPPVYGQLAAQWQVDHWRYDTADLTLPTPGRPRSAFTGGSTMVMGSPEAEAFLAAERKAIARAKDQQTSIEEHFTRDLRAATTPGTTYKGQISHPRGILPCEVRFLPTPGAEPLVTSFEVRVPQAPAFQYVYTAKLAPKVPLNLPAGDTGSFGFAAGAQDPSLPVDDLMVSYARGAGKAQMFDRNLAGVILNNAPLINNKPFLLLDGHLKGVVASFNGDFSLAADLAR